MIWLRRLAWLLLSAVLIAALAADRLSPVPYDMQLREQPDQGPSPQHPLGTDELGRDRLSRLLYGARVSLLLAPAAALLATILAGLVGGVAAWVGGWWDRALMSVADLLMSVPWLFLLLTVRAMLPLNTSAVVSVGVTFALLGCLGWAAPARAVRAGVRALLHSEFVLQGRALGIAPWRLLARHLLPNVSPILRAQFWVAVPAFVLAEANLSLLGLGVSEPLPSLGTLLRELEHVHAVRVQPALLAPLVLLVVFVACCRLAFPPKEEGV